MSKRLRQTEEKLRKIKEELLQQTSLRRPLESDPDLQQKLQQAEATLKEAEVRAEKAENRSKKMEDWL